MERAYRDAVFLESMEARWRLTECLWSECFLSEAMKRVKSIFLDRNGCFSHELTGVPSFETVDTSELFAAEKDVLKS